MPTTSLSRLLYYSRNRVVTGPDDLAAAIHAILRSSRKNNAQVGVTGALMFNAGCFAQVLEGPRDAVEAVFERIQRDDRHSDVALLAFKPVEERAFEAWSMGFVGASVADAARFGSLMRQTDFDPTRATGEALFETLRRLALEEEAPK